MTSDREEKVYQAKLAEQAERYEDMTKFMKWVADDEAEMTVEERNLLSVAYKNVIGVKRSSWRVINSVASKSKKEEKEDACIQEYRMKIEGELRDCCNDVLETLEKIISKANGSESKVFYYKMKGDYKRYMAEFCTGDERDQVAKDSEEAYKTAEKEAREKLKSTDPIRLGLALNYSVFYYEIMKNRETARMTAQQAFDDAIRDLDSLEDSSYKDSTLIMQLLRDNLTLWKQLTEGEVEDVEDEEQQQS